MINLIQKELSNCIITPLRLLTLPQEFSRLENESTTFPGQFVTDVQFMVKSR